MSAACLHLLRRVDARLQSGALFLNDPILADIRAAIRAAGAPLASEGPTFSQWLHDKLGGAVWCIAPRLTARLKENGYTLALSQARYDALEAEYQAWLVSREEPTPSPYLDRFPADHRASAERAYSDGVEDALNHTAAPVLDAARALVVATDEDSAPPLVVALREALAEFDA